MGSSVVRGLLAGAVLLSLAGVMAVIGVVGVSDVAAGGTIVTLLLVLGLVLFDGSWDLADDSSGGVAEADPVADARPSAA